MLQVPTIQSHAHGRRGKEGDTEEGRARERGREEGRKDWCRGRERGGKERKKKLKDTKIDHYDERKRER